MSTLYKQTNCWEQMPALKPNEHEPKFLFFYNLGERLSISLHFGHFIWFVVRVHYLHAIPAGFDYFNSLEREIIKCYSQNSYKAKIQRF